MKYKFYLIISFIILLTISGCRPQNSLTPSQVPGTEQLQESSDTSISFSEQEFEAFLNDLYAQNENADLRSALKESSVDHDSGLVSQNVQSILDQMYGDFFDEEEKNTFLFSSSYGFCTMYQAILNENREIVIDSMDYNGDPENGYSWETVFRFEGDPKECAHHTTGNLTIANDGKIKVSNWHMDSDFVDKIQS